MQHDGKIAVVTGAAQGIGLACAEKLHAEGAKVVMGDVQGDKVAEAAAALDASGATAIGMACDVSSQAEVNALAAKATDTFGRLDIMVNNAGLGVAATVLEITEEDFDRIIGINLKGTLFGSQAAARVMVEQENGGAIVNMSSAQALLAIPNSVPYGISKAGINQLTRIFAVSLADKNVRCNAVGPGTINTDMARNAVLSSDAAYRMILSRTPLGRLGEASEVASVVSFLASDEASYVTGQVIYPDGGRQPVNYVMPVPEELPEL